MVVCECWLMRCMQLISVMESLTVTESLSATVYIFEIFLNFSPPALTKMEMECTCDECKLIWLRKKGYRKWTKHAKAMRIIFTAFFFLRWMSKTTMKWHRPTMGFILQSSLLLDAGAQRGWCYDCARHPIGCTHTYITLFARMHACENPWMCSSI